MVRNNDYNPLIYTTSRKGLSRAINKGDGELKKYLRSCAGNYTKRKEVRKFILDRDGHKCVRCGSEENLEMDHIISVFAGWKRKISLKTINSLDNLQTLCRSCNARKDAVHG